MGNWKIENIEPRSPMGRRETEPERSLGTRSIVSRANHFQHFNWKFRFKSSTSREHFTLYLHSFHRFIDLHRFNWAHLTMENLSCMSNIHSQLSIVKTPSPVVPLLNDNHSSKKPYDS